MKHQIFTITVLSLAAMAGGCDKKQTTSEQIEKVKVETQEAAQDMKDYAFAQKAEFVEKMERQLAAINQDLEKLAARIEKSTDAAKAEAKPKLEALRGQVAKLNKQLDEARNATESTWGDVKAAFKKGYGEVKDGFLQARQWVSDKIAP
jgi:chromosome segregation ATPase